MAVVSMWRAVTYNSSSSDLRSGTLSELVKLQKQNQGIVGISVYSSTEESLWLRVSWLLK